MVQRAEGKLYRWWTSWQLLTCWLARNRMGAGPCMPRNWHYRRSAVPPTDTVMQYSGNNVAFYQASGTEVPILGTARWAEFSDQSFALRLERGHPGRNAWKRRPWWRCSSVQHIHLLSSCRPLTLQDNRTRECNPRRELRNSPWDGPVGHQKLSLSSSHPGWSSCS